jgi:hypothetical protein
MLKGKIKEFNKTFGCVLICLTLGFGSFLGASGCSSQYQTVGSQSQQSTPRSQSDHALPRAVYISPDMNIYSEARVVIQSFQSPSYAPNTGDYAARSLSRHLLGQEVFPNVRVELENDSYSISSWEGVLAANDCDILITGQVLFFLEGSTQQPSKVVIEIKVYEWANKSLRLLWHMQTAEIGRPRSAKDLYAFRIPPVPAPSGQDLIDRCMHQCAQALLRIPPRQGDD